MTKFPLKHWTELKLDLTLTIFKCPCSKSRGTNIFTYTGLYSVQNLSRFFATQLSWHQQDCFWSAPDLPPQANIPTYENTLCRNPWWFIYVSRNWKRVEEHNNCFCCPTYSPSPLMCEISRYSILDALIFFKHTFFIHSQLPQLHIYPDAVQKLKENLWFQVATSCYKERCELCISAVGETHLL